MIRQENQLYEQNKSKSSVLNKIKQMPGFVNKEDLEIK